MSETGVWTVVHGMVFGGIFLIGFSAGFVALFSLRTERTTEEGRAVRARRLPIYGRIAVVNSFDRGVDGLPRAIMMAQFSIEEVFI